MRSIEVDTLRRWLDRGQPVMVVDIRWSAAWNTWNTAKVRLPFGPVRTANKSRSVIAFDDPLDLEAGANHCAAT